MTYHLQHKNSNIRDVVLSPTPFVIGCIIAFVVAVATTIYFCVTMGYEMKMPGDWKMSMMWMRMPGQTWLLAILSFLLMWFAMMIAMMMPSALPLFLKTQRRSRSLLYMATGYFIVWILAGLVICILGFMFNDAAMSSENLSRAVPLLSGVSLIAAGIFQFTNWKMTQLLRCRSGFGCATSCTHDEKSFRIGCKQGLACCACCSSLMFIEILLGIMNPLVMVIVAVVITAEKLFSKPVIVARLAGITAIVAGVIMIMR